MTALPVNSGVMEFSWSPTTSVSKVTNLYYIACTPDWYHGNYPEDFTYFTRTTSMVISRFQEGMGYTCTLSTMDVGGKLYDESIYIHMKSLGQSEIKNINNCW